MWTRACLKNISLKLSNTLKPKTYASLNEIAQVGGPLEDVNLPRREYFQRLPTGQPPSETQYPTLKGKCQKGTMKPNKYQSDLLESVAHASGVDAHNTRRDDDETGETSHIKVDWDRLPRA